MNEPNYTAVTNLIEARKHLKMTQKEFAAILGVSHPTIIAIENDTRKIQAGTLEKLERVLRDYGVMYSPWTSDEADILYIYKELSLEAKTHILAIMRLLRNSNAEN